MAGPLSEFAAGARYLGRGLGIISRSPGLFVLGAIPAVLTMILLIGALIALGTYATDIATWATPFADGWADWARSSVRVVGAVLVLVGGLALSLVAYTALTLLIGGPFYEAIAERVEDTLGLPPFTPVPWWRQFLLGLRASVVLVATAVAFAIPLFLSGLIPVVGQTVIPVCGLLVNGWLLTLEVIGVPCVRRGMTLADRHRLLRGARARTLGFAVPATLLCLIPLAAIVVMPVAVAGGTLLAGDRLRAVAPHPV